jgi:hypothetical protein
MTQPLADYPTLTVEELQVEICRLQDFKAEWEPVLIQMVPALVSIVRLATSMMPPAMQTMIPPQVLSFVVATEKDAAA